MKFADLDSRPLANKGVECKLYNPATAEPLAAGIVMLGADSEIYKTKVKEIQERHRLEGKQITAEQAYEDSIEILVACAVSWHGIEGEDGKDLAFTSENVRAALRIPEIYRQVGDFSMRRANFLPTASVN